MTDFPFDASGCCPACGDTTDSDSLLCDGCMEMVRNDPRTPARPCRNAEEFIAREEQKHIELMWSGRNVVTGADLDFLADLKIVYGGCCGLELNAEPRIERGTVYIKIEMAREFVIKHKKSRNRKSLARRRKSAFRPKMGEYAV